MVSGRTPDDPRELLGAHALGAVSAEEAAIVEALILEDHAARAEMHALELGAAWLHTTDPSPEARVWANIAAEIERDQASNVVPLPRRHQAVRSIAAVAAALALVVVAGAGIARVVDDRGAETDSVTAAARAAANDPASERVVLTTPRGAIEFVAFMRPDRTGYVLESELDQLPIGKTYQLWAITPDGEVSAAIFGRNPAVEMFRVPKDAFQLALTVEPQGGSARPTGDVVAHAAV